jgi:pimeloyl-ACP methyl ester carboxylesterase
MLARKMISAGREIWAYARQASLLHRDIGRPPLPEALRGEDVVIGLHGIFATAGVMRPLRATLERQGVATLAMSYMAGPGVATLAERLGDWLSGFDARIHLVGHSLGGVVARYFAVHTRDERVVQTISLASPFGGVKVAAVARFGLSIPFARDLDEGSPLLRELRLAKGVPHLSLIASEDHVVQAPVAHALPGGEVVVLDGVGHNGMLFDERVAECVSQRVLRARAAR